MAEAVTALQVGNGDLALATAPLHARGTVRDSARVSFKIQCTAARDGLYGFPVPVGSSFAVHSL